MISKIEFHCIKTSDFHSFSSEQPCQFRLASAKVHTFFIRTKFFAKKISEKFGIPPDKMTVKRCISDD